jgi:hypothetical protein
MRFRHWKKKGERKKSSKKREGMIEDGEIVFIACDNDGMH